MNCPKCGAEVSDGASFCGHCGWRMGGAGGAAPVNGTPYLVLSILEILFCCWPAAIPAIAYAAKLLSCKDKGDNEGARRNADKAKLWIIISAAAGFVATVVYIIALIVMAKNGMLNGSLEGLMSV